jgi:hypothetical protein
VTRERWRLLVHVVRLLEPMMAVLGVIWLILVIVDLTRGLSPALTTIWMIFIADFIGEFAIAPNKRLYLRKNWIVALSLTLPALQCPRHPHRARGARRAIRARVAAAANAGVDESRHVGAEYDVESSRRLDTLSRSPRWSRSPALARRTRSSGTSRTPPASTILGPPCGGPR